MKEDVYALGVIMCIVQPNGWMDNLGGVQCWIGGLAI